MMNTIFKSLLLSCLSLSLSTSAMADNQYGLKDKIQDGVILHCFDWTAAQIEAEIPNIAAAGFTAVQLSPVHQKEGQSSWYMAYQPYDYYVGNSIASTESLKSLCTAAHKYGVKVIVDVIANHTNGSLQYVAARLQDTNLYHTYGEVSNWGDRYQVINGEIGMKDLDTNNSTVQSIIKAYIAELKADGVDGIRWDAAKHIGLPSEGDSFWANVPDQTMYNYGEILDNTGGNDSSLFPEYQKYISITDNSYGNGLANSFSGGSVPQSIGAFNQRGANTAKLVYWGESHDTYSNDGGESKYKSQNAIDRAYAIAAGNNGATALYFSRPFETAKSSIKMGVKGSTHFTSPEVAEVNHCHNICAGEPNYYVHASQVGAQVRNSGCIMATGNGQAQDVSFANGDGKGGWLTPGTYTDKVAGGQFTVTTSTISGHVGSTGIAVIYNAVATPQVAFSTNGGSFSETLQVTATLNNATSGTFSVNGGAAQSISASGTTFTLGQDDATTYTVTWTATDGTQENSGSVVYNKITPYVPAVSANEISCFVESNAETIGIWVWDATNKTNYTGGVWANKPNMELMGVNAQGKNIFKWTYTGSLTAIPEKVIFIADGVQSDDLTYTNNGYYINNVVDHVVTATDVPDVPDPSYSLVCADATAQQGQTVTLSLNLTTENLSVTGLQCLITLPEGVTSGSDGLLNAQASADRCDGHTLMTTRTNNGYALTLLDTQNSAIKGNDGAIATFDVTVSSTAALGDLTVSVSDLTLTSVDASSAITTYKKAEAVTSVLTVTAGSSYAAEIEALRKLVQEAQTLCNNSTEGTAVGQYETGSRDALQNVITEVNNKISDSMELETIQQCTRQINTATELFNSKKITQEQVEDTDLSKYTDAIYVENLEVRQGTQCTLSVKLKNTDFAVSAYQTDIFLPNGFTVAKNADDSYAVNLCTDRIEEKDVQTFGSNVVSNGAVRLLFGTKGKTLSGTEGTIATILVNVDASVATGSYAVMVKNTVLNHNASDGINVEQCRISDAITSHLTVVDYLMGDVNNDNNVDILDLTYIEDFILEDISDINLKAADLNDDLEINVSDWSLLCRMLLTSNCSRKRASSSSVGEVKLKLNDAQISRGSQVVIPVQLSNPNSKVSCYQFDLALLEGIRLIDAQTDVKRCYDQESRFAQLSNGMYRVLVTSMSDSVHEGTEGTVLYLTLAADVQCSDGNHDIMLQNACLTHSGSSLKAAATVSKLNIVTPTDIETLNGASSANSAIYSIDGRRVSAISKGVNLVRMSDGSIRKIVTK